MATGRAATAASTDPSSAKSNSSARSVEPSRTFALLRNPSLNRTAKISSEAPRNRNSAAPVTFSTPSRVTGSSSVPHAAVPQGFYSLRYCMDHPRRGTAVIINNREFLMKDTPYRKGSDNDAVTLHKTLLKLGFKVDAWTDLTAQSMRDAMAFYAKMDHSDADCFFLSIFSHGEDGVIYGTDSKVTLGELTAPFRGDRCTTLAAKPKIFVIQVPFLIF